MIARRSVRPPPPRKSTLKLSDYARPVDRPRDLDAILEALDAKARKASGRNGLGA
jgi:hypothetical protein